MPILSVQPRKCAVLDLFRRSMIQDDQLPLADIIDGDLFAGAFENHQVRFGIADEDVFTPAITLWAMVSAFLHRDVARSVKAAAGRVVSLMAQRDGRVVTENPGNYCRAKAKIPYQAIRQISRDLANQCEIASLQYDDPLVPLEADQLEDRLTPKIIADVRSQPHSGRIILVDGFTIDAPDTPENQAEYPQNPAQAAGLGFPMMRCVCLISMLTGLLIDLAEGPYSGKGSGETALLRQLMGSLRRGDILVADSYYCTYWLIAVCRMMGVELVMKNHDKREDHPLGAKRLCDGQRTVVWMRPERPDWMSVEEYAQMPETIEVRLADIVIPQKGFRSQGYTIATTMLDYKLYDSKWIASLYRVRWLVELDIRTIKDMMGMEHLRSQTPDGMRRELWTGLLTYNLVRHKMLQSSYAAGREPRSMSFAQTYGVLATNWMSCASVGVTTAVAMAAQAQGAATVIGSRPDRVEPRANKRRPKTLKLMTVPRPKKDAKQKAAA